MLISFSGLDGSGKTTFITEIKDFIEKNNGEVKVLSMYDNVSFFSFIRLWRDRIVKIVHRSRKKRRIGNNIEITNNSTGIMKWASRFIDRTRGNIRFKQCVYIIDMFILICLSLYHRKLKGRVLILDRYFYDSLADISLNERGVQRNKWRYIKSFLLVTPKPNLPIFIDVDAEIAFKRKDEYSVEYNKSRRDVYLKLFGFVNNSVILKNDDLNTALSTLKEVVKGRILTPRCHLKRTTPTYL